MSDAAPKSAVELAMERLRRKDAESGLESRPLSAEQKAAIADARQWCEAKLAEREILHRSTMAGVFDPGERARLEEEYRRDRDRYISDRDRKIEHARGQDG